MLVLEIMRLTQFRFESVAEISTLKSLFPLSITKDRKPCWRSLLKFDDTELFCIENLLNPQVFYSTNINSDTVTDMTHVKKPEQN